jgi:hypothetical protein
VALLVVGAVLFAAPGRGAALWPWRLTPLTAQVVAGWFALPSVVALMMAVDARWSAIRITLQSQVIGLAFILLAIARAWGDFDTSNPLTYVFAGGLGLLLVGLLTLAALARGAERRAAVSAPRA